MMTTESEMEVSSSDALIDDVLVSRAMGIGFFSLGRLVFITFAVAMLRKGEDEMCYGLAQPAPGSEAR